MLHLKMAHELDRVQCSGYTMMMTLRSSSFRVHLHLRSVPARHAAVLAPTVSEDLPSETKHLQPGHAHVPLRDSGHLGTERPQPEVRLTGVYRYVLDLPMKVNSLLPAGVTATPPQPPAAQVYLRLVMRVCACLTVAV